MTVMGYFTSWIDVGFYVLILFHADFYRILGMILMAQSDTLLCGLVW
jgi:hypothetical protein